MLRSSLKETARRCAYLVNNNVMQDTQRFHVPCLLDWQPRSCPGRVSSCMRAAPLSVVQHEHVRLHLEMKRSSWHSLLSATQIRTKDQKKKEKNNLKLEIRKKINKKNNSG